MPPPLHALLENTLPSALTKSFLTKGLQNPSPLVQHIAALTVCKCLTKFESLVRTMRGISESLEEDVEQGLWASRLRAFQNDMAKRLPDYRAVVAFRPAIHPTIYDGRHRSAN